MKDPIYVVNPEDRSTVVVTPTTFYDLNVKERQDLQEWLMNRPEVLGEDLLLITSEFDRFDRSDRRLDLLLLDRRCRLVIAELKLDAAGTLADQQAIRYAAFCSTMTIDDVVNLLAARTAQGREEAVSTIAAFVGLSEPILDGEPRIILAAGAFNDQELTSTVMWLRKFRVDISCVELTPYRHPNDAGNILLVPKILIPLPEARDYVVSVERKERNEIDRKADTRFSDFYRIVLNEYASLDPTLPGPKNPSTQDWFLFGIGRGDMHYEWQVRRRPRFVYIAIHFESPDQQTNRERLSMLLDALPDLASNFRYESINGDWGSRGFTQFAIKIPFGTEMPDATIAREAAIAMRDLIAQTHSTLMAMPR